MKFHHRQLKILEYPYIRDVNKRANTKGSARIGKYPDKTRKSQQSRTPYELAPPLHKFYWNLRYEHSNGLNKPMDQDLKP